MTSSRKCGSCADKKIGSIYKIVRQIPGAATCNGVVGTLRPPDSSSWAAKNRGLSYIRRPEDKKWLALKIQVSHLLQLIKGVFNGVTSQNMFSLSTSLWCKLSQVRVWGGAGLWHVLWRTKPEARHARHLGRANKKHSQNIHSRIQNSQRYIQYIQDHNLEVFMKN